MNSFRYCAVLFLIATVTDAAPSQQVQPWDQVKVEINVRVPMQDGATLSADVYRPALAGKFPALLMRTYWGKHEPGKIAMALHFVKTGYAVVLQDVRGRFDSGGEWTPYVNEPKDGYDTQVWLGKQP